jgi:hypothetical protein
MKRKTPVDSCTKIRNVRRKADIPPPPVLNHLNKCVKTGDVEDIGQVLEIEDNQYWIIQYQLNLE